jgi:hypothetical protein
MSKEEKIDHVWRLAFNQAFENKHTTESLEIAETAEMEAREYYQPEPF